VRLPDFFIIGAAKAGTTSLYAILDRHPDIFMPKVKEPEFFARDDRYNAGIESYAAAFADATPHQIVGEASTIYSMAPFFPDTAARIKAHVPEAKLIYVMRQPVERAYSFYTQIIKNYQNDTKDMMVHRSFEEFVLPESHATAAPRSSVFSRATDHFTDVPELCLAGSDYVKQIEAYLAHFPRDQMLFLKFEDFVRDGPTTIRKITNFLGIAPLDSLVFSDGAAVQNVSQDHFETVAGMLLAERWRKRYRIIWGLRRLLPRNLKERVKRKRIGRNSLSEVYIPLQMKPETREVLQNRFASEIPYLTQITGLYFDDWGY
jgi:hypothetical protein